MTGARQPTQLVQWSRLTGITPDTLRIWADAAGLERDGRMCYEFEAMRGCIVDRPGSTKLLRRRWRTSVKKIRAMTYEDFNAQTSFMVRDKRSEETKKRIAKRNREAQAMMPDPKLKSPPVEIGTAYREDPEDTEGDDRPGNIEPGTLFAMPDGSIDQLDWTDSDCIDPETGQMDVEMREKKYRGFRQKLAAARDRSELVKRDYALAFLNASYMKILTALNTLPDRTASKILALVESGLSPTDRATEIRKCLESATDEVIRSVHDEMTDTGGRLDSTVKSCIARQGGNRL